MSLSYTGPEPSDPTQPEQAYRPVAELTRDELCAELTEARQTLEAIYPYSDNTPKTASERKDAVRELVRNLLIPDLIAEPEFWAQWIEEHMTDDSAVEFLDLNRSNQSDAADLIAKLGFDPRI